MTFLITPFVFRVSFLQYSASQLLVLVMAFLIWTLRVSFLSLAPTTSPSQNLNPSKYQEYDDDDEEEDEDEQGGELA
jgi:hypothetical protein